MKLLMPDTNGVSELKESHAATIVLGKDHKVYYYEGRFDDAIAEGSVHNTGFAKQGVRDLIMKKKNQTGNDLVVIIRPSEECSYADVVEAMDEMMITQVEKFMVVDVEKGEYEKIRSLRL